MTNYEIDIELLGDTAQALLDGGYSLYAFKAVKGPKGGRPLVWFKTNDFLATVSVRWFEVYGAYISNEQMLKPNVTVKAQKSFPKLDLGQIVTIKDAGGDGEVSTGGESGAITIANNSGVQFVTGISQQNDDGGVTAMCAFPLHGTDSDVITPIERVILMFATTAVNTGTVIEQAFGKGLMFDMTTKAGAPVSVKYDIDAGWDFGTQTICTNIGFDENLIHLLVLSA